LHHNQPKLFNWAALQNSATSKSTDGEQLNLIATKHTIPAPPCESLTAQALEKHTHAI
jgi:hypothetical protein